MNNRKVVDQHAGCIEQSNNLGEINVLTRGVSG